MRVSKQEFMQELMDTPTSTPTDSHVTDTCEVDVDSMTSSAVDRRHVIHGHDVISNGALQVDRQLISSFLCSTWY